MNELSGKALGMKPIIATLNKANEAYFKNDCPIMSDKEYDALYDKLVEMEKETGVIISNSPTLRPGGELLEFLPKVKHSKPMLSANKTKDIGEIVTFCNKAKAYASYKMDGLTLVLRYKEGELIQAITRGKGGIIGEEVTPQAKMIMGLPLTIPYTDELELRGECIISWDNFHQINDGLEEPYSHPRNLAAGSIRVLDTTLARSRFLEFVAFESVTKLSNDKNEELDMLHAMGFDTVKRVLVTSEVSVTNAIDMLKPEYSPYPVDGLVFEYVERDFSESLGATGRHENCRIALKWKDEIYPTKLLDIEWSMGKTGVLTPVAIMQPVEIDGSIIERASLHNLCIMDKLRMKLGCTVYVYKANMIIPQIHSADDDGIKDIELPTVCPVCGHSTEIIDESIYCSNLNCKGRNLGKITHYTGSEAMDIAGLSVSTIEKFMSIGLISCISDIYNLHNYKEKLKSLEGFGEKSVENLLQAIEESKKNVAFANFLYAFSIPTIGRKASKQISAFVEGNWNLFVERLDQHYDFTKLEDFGPTMNDNLYQWYYNDSTEAMNIAKEMSFEISVTKQTKKSFLTNKNVCVTGKLTIYTNRDELVEDLESHGGKFVKSVTKNTDYLVNNNAESASSKNIKAKKLGVPIISEEEFVYMIRS